MITLAHVLISASLLMAVTPVLAQQQFVIELQISDPKFETPRFSAPSVRYEIRAEEVYIPSSFPIVDKTPEFRAEPFGFTYEPWPLDASIATRTFAHFVIGGLDTSEFLPVNPYQMRLLLNPERLGNGTIVQKIDFDTRSAIAESYRREVNGLTRQLTITPNQNLSAFSAAAEAINLDPKIDNFMLMAKVLKLALRTDTDSSTAPLTVSQLRALPGFTDLTLSEQWTVQSEFLNTLTGSPDLSRKIDPTRTVLDVALSLGSEMIGQIDFSNPEHTALPIVQVFQTLSYLHSSNEDCFALGVNNSEAIKHSAAIAMNWASQRTLMLDWGTCLEKLSGFDLGLPREQLAAALSGNAILKEEWRRYGMAGQVIKDRLDIADGDSASRILSLVEFANLVSEG